MGGAANGGGCRHRTKPHMHKARMWRQRKSIETHGWVLMDDHLTRRECLKRSAGAVIASGVAVWGGIRLADDTTGSEIETVAPPPNFFGKIDFPTSNPRISVALGNEDQVGRLVRSAVSGLDPRAGIKRFISQGDVVLIKPNIGFDRPPYLGATTHPDIVRELVRLCFEAGARKVLVTDHPIESPQACFRRSLIHDAAEAEGATLLLPAPSHFATVAMRNRPPDRRRGEAIGHWPILHRPLAEANKVIGVAPIKDHNLCSASMNLKNWYGLLGGRRNQFHQVIHETISDLASMISPTLMIADATRVMMRSGPTGGRLSDVRPGGLLGRPAVIASVDSVACDAWCYERLLGRDPAKLTYLELAHAKIAAQVAGGWKRINEREWRTYDRLAQIAVQRL